MGMTRSKLEDSEFASLYAVRHDYEDMRLRLTRGLTKWAEGEVAFESIFPTVKMFEAAHRKLIETIYAHREIRAATAKAWHEQPAPNDTKTTNRIAKV